MKTLSDAEIDVMATRFAIGVTEAVMEIVRQVAEGGDEWEDLVYG